jgi:ribosomal protein L11 methyltransferase
MTSYYNVSIPVGEASSAEIEERCFALGAESVTVYDTDSRVVALTRQPDVFLEAFHAASQARVAEWEHGWFAHFDGAALLPDVAIKAFDKPLPKSLEASKYIIELDPRDAFGDGLHATTKLCARLCREVVRDKVPMHALDVGTGSGVLAIWLSMLGVAHVEAFDIEPLSVEKARQNCVRNTCPDVTVFEADIHSFSSPQRYDLVVANVLTSIVESSIDQLIALLAPSGTLILSGIGAQWESDILSLLDSKGLNVHAKLELDGWLGIQCGL